MGRKRKLFRRTVRFLRFFLLNQSGSGNRLFSTAEDFMERLELRTPVITKKEWDALPQTRRKTSAQPRVKDPAFPDWASEY